MKVTDDILNQVLHEAGVGFQNAVSKFRGYDVPLLTLRGQDRLRLLTLQAWAYHYKVPLSEVVSVLLSYWDKKGFGKQQRPRNNQRPVKPIVGTTIATLVGPVSQWVLDEHIHQAYPAKENVTAWKEGRRQQILEASSTNLSNDLSEDDQVNFVEQYATRVRGVRKRREKSFSARSRFKRRRYRDNPWF